MAFMKFYVGNEANASSHRDGIYIAIDTKKIFYNGDAYGGSEVDLSNYATKEDLNKYLPLTGGILTGNLYVNGRDTTGRFGVSLNRLAIKVSAPLSMSSSDPYYEYSSQLDNHSLIISSSVNNGIVLDKNGIQIRNKTASDLLNAGGGTISIQEILSQVTIPKATTSTLGGIKVGDGLEITDDGTLNCTIDPGSGSVSWGNITSKPSVFATNIDSINDLNSGWDALLKAAPNIPSLDGYATKKWINGKGFLTSVPSEYVTDTELNRKGFLTKATADSTYQAKGNYLTSVSWSQVSDKPTFATVATSGSYNDLTNKPTIPKVSTVNHSGTISLVIDSNTLSFRSDRIAFNGATIITVPVVEVLSTEEINRILNS